MTNSNNTNQLNPFELKTAITGLLNKINSVDDIGLCINEIEILQNQENKNFISKILLKELNTANVSKIPVICFLLEYFLTKEELVSKYWETLKNQNLNNEAKITVLNILREIDADWSYENCEEYLDDANALLDENTKQLLNSAIINPEVQIDFMDFMSTIRTQDKIALLNSLSEDFTSDALANILIPVFVSNPDSAEGKEALKLLANTKSELAFNILEQVKPYVTNDLLQEVKRSLSTIKISGIRKNNTDEFYKKALSDSKPDKFYITYPDGHGDVAMIFTRVAKNNKIRFVSIVINVTTGIKDCFGFFEISQFECDKILERFLRNEKTVSIFADAFKTILYNAELTTIKNNQNNWKLPYEYVCWKTLLNDIEFEKENIDQILQENIQPAFVNENSINKLEQFGITKHWFLDIKYSEEFENVLKSLKNSENIDYLIQLNIDKVFYLEEKVEWLKKLLLSAYIKYSIEKEDQAELIYGFTQDDNAFRILLNNILKRSIYEYLTAVKYDKNVERYGLNNEEIEDKLNYIENTWVSNV